MPYYLDCADIIDNIPFLPIMDRTKIMQTCQSRFESIMRNMHGTREDGARNPNLLIIDLDEAIIDQRTFYIRRNQTSSKTLKFLNQNDLVYNFNEYNQLSFTESIGFSFQRRIGDIGMIGIFKKNLMNFIGGSLRKVLIVFTLFRAALWRLCANCQVSHKQTVSNILMTLYWISRQIATWQSTMQSLLRCITSSIMQQSKVGVTAADTLNSSRFGIEAQF